MQTTTLECQGLPCPQPVLRCKHSIEADAPASLTVILDNKPAQENVSRYLSTQGYAVRTETQGANQVVIGEKADDTGADNTCEPCMIMSEETLSASTAKTVAFITTEFLGAGDDALGEKLMLNFLATLPELGNTLWRIVLVNGAVKLAVAGHPCLEKLLDLSENNVEILVCGTCLEHFSLLESKAVGQTTNMLDVVTSLQLASKVIKV